MKGINRENDEHKGQNDGNEYFPVFSGTGKMLVC